MKDIKNFITESSSTWVYNEDIMENQPRDIDLPKLGNPENKWLFINTEGEMIAPVSEADLKSWADEMGEGDNILKECQKLKIGEAYDADGGISIYVRIKK